LKLVPLLLEINAQIMGGEVMEVIKIMEMEIFHTVAIRVILGQIMGQIKGGRRVVLLGPIMVGQVGPTPIIDPAMVGPQITDPVVGLPAIDLVGLLAIDPAVGPQVIDLAVGPQVIDPVGGLLAIDPAVGHPAIDPVVGHPAIDPVIVPV
jgi:hypothetical protein